MKKLAHFGIDDIPTKPELKTLDCEMVQDILQPGFLVNNGGAENAVRFPNPYEQRPRRRTKMDRYEPNKGTPTAEKNLLRSKSSRKRTTLMARNSSRVAEKFLAKNIKAGRLTLKSNENIGIFKKGNSSSSINCVNISYPTFSEIQFLRGEPRPSSVHEEKVEEPHFSEKSPKRSSRNKYSVRTSIEKRLFDSLADCQQLNMPYEKYSSDHLGKNNNDNQLLSLENLKDLYKERQRRCNNVYDSRAQTGNLHGPDISAGCSIERETAFPYGNILYRPVETLMDEKEVKLDTFLEMVKDFDGELALEVFTDLFNAGEIDADILEQQPAYWRGLSCDALDIPYFADVIASDYLEPKSGPTRTASHPSMHIPVNTAIDSSEKEKNSTRPFWRCNKLY